MSEHEGVVADTQAMLHVVVSTLLAEFPFAESTAGEIVFSVVAAVVADTSTTGCWFNAPSGLSKNTNRLLTIATDGERPSTTLYWLGGMLYLVHGRVVFLRGINCAVALDSIEKHNTITKTVNQTILIFSLRAITHR